MADTHGHDPKGQHDPHAHDHAVEEDVVRTPMWLPALGIGLLMAGALATYLWVYPGTMSASSTVGDAGAGEAAVEAPANPPDQAANPH
jgi:hypothetical protein